MTNREKTNYKDLKMNSPFSQLNPIATIQQIHTSASRDTFLSACPRIRIYKYCASFQQKLKFPFIHKNLQALLQFLSSQGIHL